jgi:hypothetical protein
LVCVFEQEKLRLPNFLNILKVGRREKSCFREIYGRFFMSLYFALASPGLPDGITLTKIPILVYFVEPWNGKCRYILYPFGAFLYHWVRYMRFDTF